jgi:hypothetical protein
VFGDLSIDKACELITHLLDCVSTRRLSDREALVKLAQQVRASEDEVDLSGKKI